MVELPMTSCVADGAREYPVPEIVIGAAPGIIV